MGLTITYKIDRKLVDSCSHGYKFVRGSIAFDASYPTGGEEMDLRKIFPTSLDIVMIEPKLGYSFEYDYANRTVKAFTPFIQHTHTFQGSALGVHTHTFDGSALDTHQHKSFIVDATETAADVQLFVPVLDGAGQAVAGVTIGHAGGAGADIDVPGEAKSAGTPAGTNAEITAGTPAGTNANAAAAAATEVTPGANLLSAGLTDVRFLAFGY